MTKVLIRKQNEDFQVVKLQQDEIPLSFMQQAVGGHIELFRWCEQLNERGIDLWLNEEGKLIEGLKPTFVIKNSETGEVVDFIFGDTLFTGVDEYGETTGLDDLQVQFIKSNFKQVAVLGDGTIATVINI